MTREKIFEALSFISCLRHKKYGRAAILPNYFYLDSACEKPERFFIVLGSAGVLSYYSSWTGKISLEKFLDEATKEEQAELLFHLDIFMAGGHNELGI